MTATLDTNALRESNFELAHRWMTTLGEPAWWDMMHDDIVFEFPYAPSLGEKDRYVGKAAVTNYVRAMFARLTVFKFKNLEITGTTDPAVFFCEYQADVTTTHGEPYKQTYINKLRFKDGKTIFMREFWDPKVTIDATKGTFHLDL
jgi:ketosteroid isomerase-like protein